MSHIEIDKTVQMMVDNASQLLKSHGFEIVTEDKKLFPYFTPGLAAMKSGRLLVFNISAFPIQGVFQEEISTIQSYFQEAVETNTPESDPRVAFIEKVAVVLAPESIEGQAPSGDIHWIGIGSPSQLADRLRQELSL
ncbi:MAG: hypothetical protein ACOX87_07470 [Chloroflexota bacterium]|jgi:hypothetical protein